jgi:hypothetical protein
MYQRKLTLMVAQSTGENGQIGPSIGADRLPEVISWAENILHPSYTEVRVYSLFNDHVLTLARQPDGKWVKVSALREIR